MGDYAVLKTGFLNFAAHRKTKSDRLFESGSQDRASRSLWVRHEKQQRAGSRCRGCDYGQKEVRLGKKSVHGLFSGREQVWANLTPSKA